MRLLHFWKSLRVTKKWFYVQILHKCWKRRLSGHQQLLKESIPNIQGSYDRGRFSVTPSADCERLRLIFAVNQFPEELRAMIKFLNMIMTDVLANGGSLCRILNLYQRRVC